MSFEWLNENSKKFLQGGYLKEGVTAQERIKEIADYAEGVLKIEGFSAKFYDYMSKGYYSLSSPVWSNFGTNRGLSISCFGSSINDTMPSILSTHGEVGMMSKFGGGTSGYFGNLRPRGAEIKDNGESSGAVHFMEMFDKLVDTTSQGCYDDKTEVLTEFGFMKFEDIMKDKSIKVAQVTDDNKVVFINPTDYMKFKPEDNELLLFKDSKNIDLLVTKNHNMVFKRERKKVNSDKTYTRTIGTDFEMKQAFEAPLHRDIKFAHSSKLPSNSVKISALEQLYIAFQADGAYSHSDSKLRFRFSKKRKCDRLISILNELGYHYDFKHNTHSDNTYNITVDALHSVPKVLVDWVTLDGKGLEWAESFLLEVSMWDGTTVNDEYKSFSYSSVIESNVDVVQAVSSLVGAKSRKTTHLRENEPTKSTIYTLYITQKSEHFGVEKVTPAPTKYDGYVYCVEVPSHKLIVRRGGHTLVCGNSMRRGAFSPYLPIEHLDAEEFLKIGSEGNPIQRLTHGVTVTDKWMKEMIDGDYEKRSLWAKVIQSRVEIGYPYIFFTDTVNNNTVDVYKDKGMQINHSNLCK